MKSDASSEQPLRDERRSGRGRPRLPAEERRTVTASISCSPLEWQELEEFRAAEGICTMAEAIRTAALREARRHGG